MKKLLAASLLFAMVFTAVFAGGAEEKKAETGPTITLWTYPIGNWGKEANVKVLTDAFKADTGITVKVEYLAYSDGDDKVNSAIAAKQAPDLVMEGPERLVANWGVSGYMVDLSDMLTDKDKAEIQPSVMDACTAPNGAVYEYPLVMTAHCMAVNLTAFKEAGADKYLNLETHTWKTDDFIKAVKALYDHYGQTVAAVYCGGQGGDQGTRALINNLYGGHYTDKAHTKYTWDDPMNVKAIEQLKSMDGVEFDASLQGGDEIANFYKGILKMGFCWNISQQLDPNNAGTGAEKTVTGDDIVFMSFPSQTGESQLQGGIWGFGIFKNDDPAKVEAAKKFINYMANSPHTVDAVLTANYFPVRSAAGGVDLTNMLADNKIMNEYMVLMPFLGDYYQVTKAWPQARTSWWNMLQKVGEGADVAKTVAAYAAEANAAASK